MFDNIAGGDDVKRSRIAFILLIPLILTSLGIVATAHPGKTDGSGGHYDNDMGGYHYHHGYPEHSHYDMDGDGIVDCPYDFDDQTGINSGGDSSGSSSSTRRTSDNGNIIYQTETVTETVIEEVPYTPSWVYWVMGGLVVLCFIKFVQVRWRNDEIEQLTNTYRTAEDQHRKALSDMEEDCSSRISQCKSSFEKTIAEMDSRLNYYINSLEALRDEHQSLQNKYQLLMNTVGKKAGAASVAKAIDGIVIPKDIYFINGTIPVKGMILDRKPFGDYTVFTAARGKCYHCDPYCAGYSSVAKHIFDVLGSKQPCSKCVYEPEEKVPEWYTQLKQITKTRRKRS